MWTLYKLRKNRRTGEPFFDDHCDTAMNGGPFTNEDVMRLINRALNLHNVELRGIYVNTNYRL